MKRVLLCALLAGACSSRAGGLTDFDSGVASDRPAATDRGAVAVDAPALTDVPTKTTDVPAAADAGSAEDAPAAVDAGFPEDLPVVVDVPPPPMDHGPRCVSDVTCSAAMLVCDIAQGVCVECVRNEDCLGAGQGCASNHCVAGFDAGMGTDRGTATDRGTPIDVSTPRDAGPGATLVTGLGGANGFGTNCLVPSDDGSYTTGVADGGAAATAIALGGGFGPGLLMRSQRYASLFLNNNGNLSFGGALAGYTADRFPRASTQLPLIAPWWADVDTTGGGQPAANQVCFVSETSRFVATWYRVGYYNAHNNLLNSFQVIVTPSGTAGDFDVEFRYSQCQWTTGDASLGVNGLGGTPAQAGIDLGDGVNALSLPGSGTANVVNLCGTSNGSVPGVWRVQVRSGVARFAS
jgi:hypothetical protein